MLQDELLQVRDELNEVEKALDYLAVNNENAGFSAIVEMIKTKVKQQEGRLSEVVQNALRSQLADTKKALS